MYSNILIIYSVVAIALHQSAHCLPIERRAICTQLQISDGSCALSNPTANPMGGYPYMTQYYPPPLPAKPEKNSLLKLPEFTQLTALPSLPTLPGLTPAAAAPASAGPAPYLYPAMTDSSKSSKKDDDDQAGDDDDDDSDED